MQERSWKEILPQGRLEIGYEFVKDARRSYRGRCERSRLGCDRLNLQRWRGFHRRGWDMGDRGRQCSRYLFHHDRRFVTGRRNFVEREFGRRFVDSEFRNGLDGGTVFHNSGGLRSGLNFSPERVQCSFVGTESLKLLESRRGLLGHAMLEIEADLFDAFGGLFRDEVSGLGCWRF